MVGGVRSEPTRFESTYAKSPSGSARATVLLFSLRVEVIYTAVEEIHVPPLSSIASGPNYFWMRPLPGLVGCGAKARDGRRSLVSHISCGAFLPGAALEPTRSHRSMVSFALALQQLPIFDDPNMGANLVA